MKKFSKYLLLLAVAVFAFTACEQDKKREPSPDAPAGSVAFKNSAILAEINPGKAALQDTVTLYRGNVDSALTVNITVEGDTDIISVPTSVSFAAGDREVLLILEFPNAQIDSTYSVKLSISEDYRSPYNTGELTCSYTVTIAAWEPAETKAVVVDGIVNVFYKTGTPAWYVSYLRKENKDGSFDIRLLNPYTVLPKYRDGNVDDPIADDYGVYDGFPYNYPEDVDSKGTYNLDIHVSAEDSATFDMFDLGMKWSNGEFYGAHLPSLGWGVYDKTANTITFPGGSVLCAMSAYSSGSFYYGTNDFVIHLDAKKYQLDNLSIKDYNDPTIEWEEQETAINIFESSIFKFVNEDQKIFKAKDKYPENPKSPYINLWCLKDLYVAGGNLAFYWDGEDTDSLDIPVPQNTKMSFLGKDLLIVDAAGTVQTDTVKGVAVKTFTFAISIETKEGDVVGDFVETFTVTEKDVIFEKSDFIGNFTLKGYSQFSDAAETVDVTIAEEDSVLVLHGIKYCSGLECDFDEATGVLSIAPQVQDSIYGAYDIAFYTTTAAGASDKAALEFAFGLSGVAKLTNTSEADGYLVRSEAAGGWLAGHYDLTLTPAAAPVSPAPAKAPANAVRDFKKHEVRSNKPSVSGLSFQGKRLKNATAL